MYFTDNQILDIVNKYSPRGYNKKLAKVETYCLRGSYYTYDDYKNDFFIFLKTNNILKRYDSSKCKLDTYMFNYVMNNFHRYIIDKSRSFKYSTNYFIQTKKNFEPIKTVDISEMAELIQDKKNKADNNNFYKEALLCTIKQFEKKYKKLTYRDRKVLLLMKGIIADVLQCNKMGVILDKSGIKQKFRIFIRNNNLKIEDLKANKF